MAAAKKKPPAASDEKKSSESAFDFSGLAKELDGLAVAQGHEHAVNDLRGYISTGCFILDAEIGEGKIVGGYPMGRFTEVFGTEGAGKTTMATEAMVACQQGRGCTLSWVEEQAPDGRLLVVPKIDKNILQPGLAILIDSEFKWPLDRAQAMGLDPRKMIRVRSTTRKIKGKMADQPLSLEFCLEELEKVLEKVKAAPYFQRPDVPLLVVWDSLAASPIEAELAGDGLQDGIASKARKVRAAMRRMTGLLADLNVTVLVINQVYDRIGLPGVEASGGRGLKFHSSHRMQLKKSSKGRLVLSQKEVGMYAKIKAVKSSVCPPTHEVTLPIRFSTGLDDDLALLDFFLEPGRKIDPNPVSSAGAWLKTVVPGQEKPISFQYGSWNKTLAEHPELRDHLRKEVMRHLRG